MRIVIDMQGAQTESRFRGIGRYSTSLALAIARMAEPHEIWLALNANLPDGVAAIRKSFAQVVRAERIRFFDVPHIDEPWAAIAAEQIRENFLTSLNPDVVLVTSIFEGFWAKAVTSISRPAGAPLTVAVLYDLIPLLSPQQYLPTAELQNYYHRKVGWLKNADLLLAISDHSRLEGLQHLSVDSHAIVNISAAVDAQFQPAVLEPGAIKDLKMRLGISRKMVMYTPGGFDSRKNIPFLIEAYSNLSLSIRQQHQLVIVGRIHAEQEQAFVQAAQRAGLKPDELLFVGYVSDKDLIALYSLAELFVFPSVHEGFGLPVLEAMACGAPAIGANNTSVPEVIGWAEAMFDPFSVKSIEQHMTRALSDREFRRELSARGRAQARKFTWDACAKRALHAIEALVDAKNSLSVQPDRLACKARRANLLRSLGQIETRAGPSDLSLRMAATCIAFNAGRSHRYLLLDISTLIWSDAKSGIQRVVRSLLKILLSSQLEGMVVHAVYFDRGVYRFAGLTDDVHTAQTRDVPVDFCQGDVYLALDLNMHLTAQVHPWHMYLHHRGVHVAFVVYDILLTSRPDWSTAGNASLFSSWLSSIAEAADTLVCISHAVAGELKVWLANNKQSLESGGPRVTSFHLGGDIDNSRPSTGLPGSANDVLGQISAKTSFLMVSTIEPRKGYAQALAAFEILWASGADVNLVIVGKTGWLVDELAKKLAGHVELNKKLFWLEGISDEYLNKVYTSASCLIAASEGEGFGLPLIEAAQHQLPLLLRDLPVFREVAGPHAFYFSGLAAADLADAIRQWMLLRSSGTHPASDAMQWLTWEQSAEQLLKALNLTQPSLQTSKLPS